MRLRSLSFLANTSISGRCVKLRDPFSFRDLDYDVQVRHSLLDPRLSSPVRAMKLGQLQGGSTTTNRVTNAFRANCQRSSSVSESIGKKCGRKLVHQASAGDIERFAGCMRGVTGCQKKSSLGNFVMLGVFSQRRKF